MLFVINSVLAFDAQKNWLKNKMRKQKKYSQLHLFWRTNCLKYGSIIGYINSVRLRCADPFTPIALIMVLNGSPPQKNWLRSKMSKQKKITSTGTYLRLKGIQLQLCRIHLTISFPACLLLRPLTWSVILIASRMGKISWKFLCISHESLPFSFSK